MPTKNNKTYAKESTNIVYPFLEQVFISKTPSKTEETKKVRDPKLAENWRVHDRRQSSPNHSVYVRNKESNKYTIPYINDKEIRLTTGRYNTGRISTNLLDSIYDSAIRVGIDPRIALGLAGRESTLGIGRGFKRGSSISGTALMSNWQQIMPYFIPQSIKDGYNSVLEKYNNNIPMTKEEADKMIKYYDENDKALASFRTMTENPIDNALKFYMTGKYNPGDKRHTQMVEEDARILMTDPAVQKWYQEKTKEQMKCGGRRKAQLGLDIREGGIAIPINKNMYYMQGRSHNEGGIGIGPNNKNGLEVEGGEVVKVDNDSIKVFSSVPFLRGVSPAQLVLRGANPNKIFKAQEDFKDKNHINDDGTTYQNGGDKSNIYATRPLTKNEHIIIGGYPTIGATKTIKFLRNLVKFNKASNMATGIFRFGKEYVKRNVDAAVNNKKLTPKVGQAIKTTYSHTIGRDGQNVPKIINLISNNEEKKYGGNMVYTINGNVKNGLISLRPKAEWGKEKRINDKTKIGADGLIYTWGPDGKWYTDGTRYEDSKYYMREKSVLTGGKRSDGSIVRPKQKTQSLDEVVVTATRPKKKEETTTSNNTSNNNTTNTKYKSAGSRFYVYDEQGNRFYRRSDGTLIRTKNLNLDKNASMLDEIVVTATRPKKDDKPKSESTSASMSDIKKDDKPVDETKPSAAASAATSNKSDKDKTTPPSAVPDPRKGETISTPPAISLEDEINLVTKDIKKSTPENKSASPQQHLDYIMKTYTNVNNDVGSIKEEVKTPEEVEERWVGQYKPVTTSDWIGLGANALGNLISYIGTNSAINKTSMPVKPIPATAVKLKTRFNINSPLTEIEEQALDQRDAISRNTSSSNVSLARQQRVMNEAQRARNQLYNQKENIETQLINQDRLNRQSVMSKNVSDYNDWLRRFTQAQNSKIDLKANNLNNLISGLSGGITDMLGRIESRRSTNNTIQAIAAANPNVDARQIGNFDYYKVYDKKTGKFIRKDKYVG